MAGSVINKLLKKFDCSSVKELSSKGPVGALERVLIEASDAYHGTGETIMTDEEFDILLAGLKKRAPDLAIVSQVGSSHVADKKMRKKKLPFPMLSLSKVKVDDGTAEKWLSGCRKINYSIKIDGVSAQLHFRKGGKRELLTRGNGSEGFDITHLLPSIDPDGRYTLPAGHSFHGELAITKKAFASKYSDEFANARNMVAGIVNSNTVSPYAKDLRLIIHRVIYPSGKAVPFLTGHRKDLEEEGHSCPVFVAWEDMTDPTTARLQDVLHAAKQNFIYEADGLVLYYRARGLTAFKDGDQSGVTTVKRVEWNITRHGALKPLVYFEPLDLAGALVSKATGHNAAYIVKNKIGKGARLRVSRSGDVIPYIKDIMTAGKWPYLPEHLEYRWDANKVDILHASNTKSSKDAAMSLTMAHFMATHGAQGFKEASFSKLIAEKVCSDCAELMNLAGEQDELRVAEVLGPTMAMRLLSEIRSIHLNSDHAAMIAATSILGKGWGLTRLRALDELIPLNQLVNDPPEQAARRMVGLSKGGHGFGPALIEQFLEGIPKYRAFLNEADWTPTKGALPKKKKFGPLLGKVFCATGFRDKNLAQAIIDKGGEWSDSLTSKTTHLVVPSEPGFSSSKVDKAKAKGITIIARDKVLSM